MHFRDALFARKTVVTVTREIKFKHEITVINSARFLLVKDTFFFKLPRFLFVHLKHY